MADNILALKWFPRMNLAYQDIKKTAGGVQQTVVARVHPVRDKGFEFTYLPYEHLADFYNKITKEYNNNVFWYECLTDGNPIKLFIDIDKVQKNAYPAIVATIQSIIDGFKELFNYDVHHSEIIVLRCKRANNISFHIHFNTKKAFSDNFQIKYFIQYVRDNINRKYAPHNFMYNIIDEKIYNIHQLFRFPYSGKTAEKPEIFELVDIKLKSGELIYSYDKCFNYLLNRGGYPVVEITPSESSANIISQCLINAPVDMELFPDLARLDFVIEKMGRVYIADEAFNEIRDIFVNRLFGMVDRAFLRMLATDLKTIENSVRMRKFLAEIVAYHNMHSLVQSEIIYGAEYENFNGSAIMTAESIWGDAARFHFKGDTEAYIEKIKNKYNCYAKVVYTEKNDEISYQITIPKKLGQVYYTELFEKNVIINIFNAGNMTTINVNSIFTNMKYKLTTRHSEISGYTDYYDSQFSETFTTPMEINITMSFGAFDKDMKTKENKEITYQYTVEDVNSSYCSKKTVVVSETINNENIVSSVAIETDDNSGSDEGDSKEEEKSEDGEEDEDGEDDTGEELTDTSQLMEQLSAMSNALMSAITNREAMFNGGVNVDPEDTEVVIPDNIKDKITNLSPEKLAELEAYLGKL